MVKAFVACLLPFLLLATLNSAGYRYGASDQAFYIPAVMLRLDPSLFPRDRDVLLAQAPLTGADEVVSSVVRVSGLSVPATCAVLYVVSLLLLAVGGLLLARTLYRTSWGAIALLAAMTLRHAVPDSGTNTLEGYFHPRQMAFAIGVFAAVAFLRRRLGLSAILLVAAATLHPTTTLWFTIWIGAAALVAERASRPALLVVTGAAAAISLWALTLGPLVARLVVMDDAWLATLDEKEYLFPLEWSWDAWLVNIGYLPVVVWIARERQRAGLSTPQERGLVAGALALAAVFAIAVPLNAARVALAVQLQPGRVFWILDLLAVVFLVWRLGEGTGASEVRARWLAAALAVFSIARGAYLKLEMFPDRPIAEVYVRDDDWGKTMAWAQSTAPDSGWLADPGHAILYGTSVRLAGRRDVLVEAVKDGALGMYDRAVAMRTRERLEAVGDFAAMTPAHARALGQRYSLDYLVTEQRLDLPVAFSSGPLVVYRLR